MPEIRLRETDQASMRQLFLAEVGSDDSPLPRAVLLVLSRLIPCDAIGVGEVDSAGYVTSGVALLVNANDDREPRVCRRRVSTAQQGVALSPDHAQALFSQANGVMDRLRTGFWVAGSRNVIQLCLGRTHAMFSDRDVAMLAMLHPALHHIMLTHPRSSCPPCLSDAERRVLELVAQGGSNQEVATHLCVTVATVRKHLEHAYRKLGVTNRTAAAATLADQPTSAG